MSGIIATIAGLTVAFLINSAVALVLLWAINMIVPELIPITIWAAIGGGLILTVLGSGAKVEIKK